MTLYQPPDELGDRLRVMIDDKFDGLEEGINHIIDRAKGKEDPVFVQLYAESMQRRLGEDWEHEIEFRLQYGLGLESLAELHEIYKLAKGKA